MHRSTEGTERTVDEFDVSILGERGLSYARPDDAELCKLSRSSLSATVRPECPQECFQIDGLGTTSTPAPAYSCSRQSSGGTFESPATPSASDHHWAACSHPATPYQSQGGCGPVRSRAGPATPEPAVFSMDSLEDWSGILSNTPEPRRSDGGDGNDEAPMAERSSAPGAACARLSLECPGNDALQYGLTNSGSRGGLRPGFSMTLVNQLAHFKARAQDAEKRASRAEQQLAAQRATNQDLRRQVSAGEERLREMESELQRLTAQLQQYLQHPGQQQMQQHQQHSSPRAPHHRAASVGNAPWPWQASSPSACSGSRTQRPAAAQPESPHELCSSGLEEQLRAVSLLLAPHTPGHSVSLPARERSCVQLPRPHLGHAPSPGRAASGPVVDGTLLDQLARALAQLRCMEPASGDAGAAGTAAAGAAAAQSGPAAAAAGQLGAQAVPALHPHAAASTPPPVGHATVGPGSCVPDAHDSAPSLPLSPSAADASSLPASLFPFLSPPSSATAAPAAAAPAPAAAAAAPAACACGLADRLAAQRRRTAAVQRALLCTTRQAAVLAEQVDQLSGRAADLDQELRDWRRAALDNHVALAALRRRGAA